MAAFSLDRAPALRPLEEDLNALIAEQQRAKEERASQHFMRAITAAERQKTIAVKILSDCCEIGRPSRHTFC
jgi:hypothetical protein